MQRRRLALWISAAVITIAAVPGPAAVVEAAEPTIVVAPGETLIGIARRQSASACERSPRQNAIFPSVQPMKGLAGSIVSICFTICWALSKAPRSTECKALDW